MNKTRMNQWLSKKPINASEPSAATSENCSQLLQPHVRMIKIRSQSGEFTFPGMKQQRLESTYFMKVMLSRDRRVSTAARMSAWRAREWFLLSDSRLLTVHDWHTGEGRLCFYWMTWAFISDITYDNTVLIKVNLQVVDFLYRQTQADTQAVNYLVNEMYYY